MNNQDFHQPFIKSLVLVALVTGLTMIGTRLIANFYSDNHINSTIFTSSSPASQDK